MEMKSQHISEARRYLDYLRKGSDQYDTYIRYVREEVRKGGFTLEDIGTSEEELEELRVMGCKVSARKYLDYLRKGSDQYDTYIRYVREEVRKGGFTLEDIGTSEEELESFKKQTV